MSKLDLLIKFKHTVVSLIDEIIEQFPRDSDLILCRLYIKDQIPTENLMDIFIKYFLPQKQSILNKEDSFFTEGTRDFFIQLNLKNNLFEKIWKSNVLDEDDRTIIWDWMETIVIIVDKYNNLENK